VKARVKAKVKAKAKAKVKAKAKDRALRAREAPGIKATGTELVEQDIETSQEKAKAPTSTCPNANARRCCSPQTQRPRSNTAHWYSNSSSACLIGANARKVGRLDNHLAGVDYGLTTG
ncbi:MAG: hypothetical protein QGG55_08535, partial [Verrucomicrobiota bacterium]|nr:hypothetical protein [Verrucomicrobiota bacterium]